MPKNSCNKNNRDSNREEFASEFPNIKKNPSPRDAKDQFENLGSNRDSTRKNRKNRSKKNN